MSKVVRKTTNERYIPAALCKCIDHELEAFCHFTGVNLM